MEWPVVLGIVVLLLPGAIALGTAVAIRSRLGEMAAKPTARVAVGAFVASAVALVVGPVLGAYTYAVTLWGLDPLILGRGFRPNDWLGAYRVAGWLILGGLGLYAFGFALLSASAARHSKRGWRFSGR